MNFLQRLSSKSAAPTDAYGSVSTLEENDTSSPHADSLQDADNFKFGNNSTPTPAVIIKDKLKGSPFSSDPHMEAPTSSPSKIKSSTSGIGSVFSSWSAAGQTALAAVVKKDATSTSKESETEPTEGKLMEEININWDYVTPAEPRTSSNDQDDTTDEEKLKQTRKVLEEEVQSHSHTFIQSRIAYSAYVALVIFATDSGWLSKLVRLPRAYDFCWCCPAPTVAAAACSFSLSSLSSACLLTSFTCLFPCCSSTQTA